MVLDGAFASGARLPATRVLAGDLGVSRNIVLLAYRQLVHEGYAGGRIGSGTYVAPELPDMILKAPSQPARTRAVTPRLSTFAKRLASPPLETWQPGGPRYDFRYGLPVAGGFPFALWRKLVTAQARLMSPTSLRYEAPGGYAPLREALAEYLRTHRGLRCRPDQIVVTNGSQQALDLVSRVLINPRDRVAIEEPHYPGARDVFRAAGARLVAVPLDGEGLAVDTLARGPRSARLAFVTPSHQFPTGTVMSLSRRLALLSWAAKAGAYVVEDDYESEYRYTHRPVEAIQGLDRHGRVVYLGTLSRMLFPALRLGYLVLPELLVPAFRAAKWYADRHTPTFLQEVLARFIGDGHFERHVRRARAMVARRCDTLLEALRGHFGNGVSWSGSDPGLHLLIWLHGLRPGKPLDALIARAARVGVGIYPASGCFLTPPKRAALLLGYAGLDESEIREGIERLARVAGLPT